MRVEENTQRRIRLGSYIQTKYSSLINHSTDIVPYEPIRSTSYKSNLGGQLGCLVNSVFLYPQTFFIGEKTFSTMCACGELKKVCVAERKRIEGEEVL